MLENFANNAQTVLNGAIDDNDTPITVASASGFPAAPFRIRVGDELMLVTAVSGTSWTVTRGVESTTATGHADGDTVTQVLTAAGLSTLPAGFIAPYGGVGIPSGWLRCDGAAVSRTAYADLFDAICYPFTGNTTNGSPNITNVSDTHSSALSELIGRPLSGAGIPSGRTIASITSVGGGLITVVMSGNASATASGVGVRSCPFGIGDGSTTFNLPDLRRRTPVGIGGTGTATLANALGSTGGAETHPLTSAEMPPHTHTYTVGNLTADRGLGGNFSATSANSTNTGSAGGSGGSVQAHNNLQPSLVAAYLVKT